MPLPMSKTALDKLGKRMVTSEQISDDDLNQFAQVAAACQIVAHRVTAYLAEIGYIATPRVKTTGTLTDKLRRQHTRLSQVQDLAGTRFVVPGRPDQDEAVSAIRDKFEALGCTCKVDDLREDGRDSHGYRAVHVIIHIDQIPVEVQVRTELQDLWAQIVEDLGDRWGRGIRYGQDPEHPDAMIQSGTFTASRREAVTGLARMSGNIANIELARAGLARMAITMDQARGRTEAARQTAELVPNAAAAVDLMTAFHDKIVEVQAEIDDVALQLRESERELRDTLQLIAEATDERG